MTESKKPKGTSLDVVVAKHRQDPDYRKAERAVNPFVQLALSIVKRRSRLGMSQEELAQKAGTHQARISKIESADLNMTLGTLISIAEALDTELEIKLKPIAETVYQSVKPYVSVSKTAGANKPFASDYYVQEAATSRYSQSIATPRQ